MSVTIYTDGSCMPNPGPGGYAFIILEEENDGVEWHVSGGENNTTNNRMELKAVISSLNFVKQRDKYIIYSDSMYVINCAKGIWSKKKNIDLWDEYDIISKDKNINWNWVKSHDGNIYNELVDKLAKKEVDKKK